MHLALGYLRTVRVESTRRRGRREAAFPFRANPPILFRFSAQTIAHQAPIEQRRYNGVSSPESFTNNRSVPRSLRRTRIVIESAASLKDSSAAAHPRFSRNHHLRTRIGPRRDDNDAGTGWRTLERRAVNSYLNVPPVGTSGDRFVRRPLHSHALTSTCRFLAILCAEQLATAGPSRRIMRDTLRGRVA